MAVDPLKWLKMAFTDLRATTWYGFPAWQLESERISVIAVPSLGAKLVSLFDKHSGREWLAYPSRPPDRKIPYGASFLEYGLYGWDEMFPTITACPYPQPGCFFGRLLPDHGEAWTLPWETTRAASGELELRLEGVALPYQLSRVLAFSAPECLQMRYRLLSLSTEPLSYLWAAHPLFAGDESICIKLPADVREVWNVQDSSTYGPAGSSYYWPKTTSLDKQEMDLRRIGPASRGDSHKFYLPPQTRVSWAGLLHEASGSELSLDWDSDSLPYLGVWVDEGRYTFETTLALEPGTGFFDGLDLAYRNQRLSVLLPESIHEWMLSVSVGNFKVEPDEKTSQEVTPHDSSPPLRSSLEKSHQDDQNSRIILS